MKRIRKGYVIGILVVLVAGSIFFFSCNIIFSKGLNFETKNKQVEGIDGMDAAIKLQNVYRSIAKSLIPAVVSLNVESEQTFRNPYREFFNDPFFRRFFGDEDFYGPKEFKRKLQMIGSGFIVTKNGYLFSNYHVVKDATKVIAVLSDNRRFEAKVVGVDPETDIAILKINAENLPVVPLGDSSEVQVGDIVIAIGSPFGLSGTYTTGVVSAVGREGMVSGFQRFIQTDAAINPGNSGGPLVNIKGEVIAINTAIASQTGGYQGIGYSVPINMAKNIAKQIVEKGKVERGYLGINISPIDSTTRKLLGLAEQEGVMVSKVEKNGPADKAGIKKGDIITSIDGVKVNSPDNLQAEVGGKEPGSETTVEVLRDKKRLSFKVKLAERPGQEVAKAAENKEKGKESDKALQTYEFLGVVFSEAPRDILEQNGADYGVLVSNIKENSELSSILEPGQIVAGINGETIRNMADLKGFADRNKNTRSLTFLVIKDGFMLYRGIER